MNNADFVTSIDRDGAIPGLAASVDVWRDEWGVPHIKAGSTDDAFAALGYVHAQDRLFQMDALRRRAVGRWAEWIGPNAVPGDTLARRMDAAGASVRDLAVAAPHTRAMLDAYARGVNAFIAAGALPVEYALLETIPEPWEPWHSIAAMRQIGFLMGSVWSKLWRAAALPVVGAELVGALRHDDGDPALICIPPGTADSRASAPLAALRPAIEALLASVETDAVGGGSNNWALSPARTATGRPLLAGDPHRRLEMPNMYAQVHLACDAFDVIGLTVPGVPGFPHFGHNQTVAWCVTHAFMDLHDLYIEQFDEGGGSVRTVDGWREVSSHEERISVQGGEDVTITVTRTHHGPIIVGGGGGFGLALRSMQFDPPDRSFDCLLPMMRADSVGTLYEATRGWGLIDHNLVAGDVSGRIGNLVRALVPRRVRANGWLPVPGWIAGHEWDGVVDFAQMPRVENPPGGVIVTANNRVVPDTDEPYLCTDALPPYRAQRVWDRIASLHQADVDDMLSIHNDRVSIPARELRTRLGHLSLTGDSAALRDRLVTWNGEVSPGSIEATGYAALRRSLARIAGERSGLTAIADAPAAMVTPGISPVAMMWWMLPGLLRRDDARLLRGATWDMLLTEALDQVAREPLAPWAEVHTPTLTHPLSALFPEAGLDPRCEPIGGDNDTVFATGYAPQVGVRTAYASLCRYVFDVGAWERCSWVVFHGASGQPGSRFYANQNPVWARGETVPMLYDWNTIKAAAATHQTLR